MDIDPKACPICSVPMRVTHSRKAGSLRRKYRTCDLCGRRDTLLVRPEEVLQMRVVCLNTPDQPQSDFEALD
jgi:transcriptional regulator NrdR family protein